MNDLYYSLFCSTCFGLSPVHHQEHHLINCITYWYVRAIRRVQLLRGCRKDSYIRAGESGCYVDVGRTCTFLYKSLCLYVQYFAKNEIIPFSEKADGIAQLVQGSGYELDDWEREFQFPKKGKRFSFSQKITTLILGSSQLPPNVEQVSFQRSKRPAHKIDQSLSSGVMFKKALSYASTPIHAFMKWC